MAEPVISMTKSEYFSGWYLTFGLLTVPYGIATFYAVKWAIIAAARYLQTDAARAASLLAGVTK